VTSASPFLSSVPVCSACFALLVSSCVRRADSCHWPLLSLQMVLLDKLLTKLKAEGHKVPPRVCICCFHRGRAMSLPGLLEASFFLPSKMIVV
jgi:hypothetical protein